MRLKFASSVAVCFALATSAGLLHAAKTVVDDPPREPAEEVKAFHVPAGFEVQLVASEPDIHKPINIAFDDRGRLWVTDTIEYPFPAAEGAKTRDTVKILEDFDETGKARKITTFADNLNIPIGVLPLGDNGALVYSIPSIWKLTDAQGTGHADKRDVFLSGYAHDDTHGMTGSFIEGFDGWIHAVHGFKNTSTVKASDGSSVTMNSGNTYRFKRDGSHIEYFTHGQVNPFGMCYDAQGNLFSSDCETMPITLLLREGYHPSFGKPDDGLGFSPEICSHMYGSTAIAGLCDYVADQFPPEYRDRMFVGNVVTSRINSAKLVSMGSGFHADDVPDLLVSDDAWFRPVNIKLGPDGALYVSDFYNRIIGHYEVDLHHPGRDKQRGRIWRIVYKGAGATPPAAKFDLTSQSVPEIVDDLASPNFTVRTLAMNRLADVIGQPAIEPLIGAVSKPKNSVQKIHGLWALYRLGAMQPEMLKSAVADADPFVRQHALRILGEMDKWEGNQRELAVGSLKDTDPVVQRMAAEALGRHPMFDNIRPLLDLRKQSENDAFLTYTIRMALRDQLEESGAAKAVSAAKWNQEDERDLADAAVATSTPDAAAFLLHYVKNTSEPQAATNRYLRTIVKSAPQDQIEDLAKLLADRYAGDLDPQLAAFKSIMEALGQRGEKPGNAIRTWGSDLARKVFSSVGQDRQAWSYHPIPENPDSANPWSVQIRASADHVSAAAFLSSLVNGETLTGVAKSATFKIPPQLSFFIAGHNGFPTTKAPIKNIVRLRDAHSDEVLAEQAPPRNDIAQKVTWDLTKVAGREGYFEATDGDSAKAYAWLAFGRFDPPVITIPGDAPRLATAVQIVGLLQLVERSSDIEKLLIGKTTDVETRVAAAKALAAMDAPAHAETLSKVVRDPGIPDAVRQAAAEALGSESSADTSSALVEAIHGAPRKLQIAFAKALAGSQGGAEALLSAVHDGKASARLLQDANIRERLNVAKPANLEARIDELTKGLPAADAEIQKLIDQRATAFHLSKSDPQRGRLVFQKNCVACHMIGGQGAHVGPQLDGIGARGVPRLCEDILDPSRNVDAAFRYSTFVLADGNVIAGIPRREEGQTLTVADSTGKEVPIDKSKITRRVESQLSLMPSNFGEVIPANDFNDLMSYLLSTKQ